jgi:hypothetical protein
MLFALRPKLSAVIGQEALPVLRVSNCALGEHRRVGPHVGEAPFCALYAL